MPPSLGNTDYQLLDILPFFLMNMTVLGVVIDPTRKNTFPSLLLSRDGHRTVLAHHVIGWGFQENFVRELDSVGTYTLGTSLILGLG